MCVSVENSKIRKQLLDKKTTALVFAAVPELVELNRALLGALLVEGKKPVEAQAIGDGFLKSEVDKRMTEPYASYCACHQRATDAVREAASRPGDKRNLYVFR